MSERVTIRTKKISKGMESVYFVFNPPIVLTSGETIERDYPRIHRFINPDTELQKHQNKVADKVINQLYDDFFKASVSQDYVFLRRRRLNDSFLDYYQEINDAHGVKYSSSYKHFFRFCSGKCKFSDITFNYCEKYKKYLSKDKSWKKKTVLNHNTVASYYNVFLKVVERAYRDGILPSDIAAEAKCHRIKWNHDINKEYLDEEEIIRLNNTTFQESAETKRACLFSIYTGLRRADVIHLDWKDIYYNSKSEPYMKLRIHKTGDMVCLPLSKSAVKVLGIKPSEGGLVFKDIDAGVLNKYVPKLIRKAKIDKHITFHCFRHTFAMTLLNKGVDIYTIAKLMGHKSVNSTQMYAKLSPEQLRKAIIGM